MERDRKRTAQTLERLRRGRQTTLPTAEAPQRSPAGPPVAGLERLLRSSLGKDAWADYHLVGPVSEQQLREDTAMWFPEAPEYVERVALLRDERPDLFPGSPVTGQDLLGRLQRSRLLQRAVDEARAFVEAAERTLRVERADLIVLADLHVAELDAQMQRPLVPEDRRQDLERAAAFPLKVWRARVERIQAVRRDNERKQNALEGARGGWSPDSDEGEVPGPIVRPPPPPAGRRRRPR
ncbi:MAG: hypothetical protein RMK29_20335 [Myxococcales bacterium]|nr:hypothetical protein [Myxococcota bacterium]MDW8284059.1 hypothetical protein [Myxococcales bacterium]